MCICSHLYKWSYSNAYLRVYNHQSSSTKTTTTCRAKKHSLSQHNDRDNNNNNDDDDDGAHTKPRVEYSQKRASSCVPTRKKINKSFHTNHLCTTTLTTTMMMTTVMIQNFSYDESNFIGSFKWKCFTSFVLQWKKNCSTIVKISGHKFLFTRNEWIEFIWCLLLFFSLYLYFDWQKLSFDVAIAGYY